MATRLQTIARIIKLAAFAVLLTMILATGFQNAGAEPKKDVSAPGQGQVLVCQGMGGSATVGTIRTPGGGLTSTTVTCNGGMADGLSCTNNQSGTTCSFREAAPRGSKRPSAAQIARETAAYVPPAAVESGGTQTLPTVEQSAPAGDGSVLEPLPGN